MLNVSCYSSTLHLFAAMAIVVIVGFDTADIELLLILALSFFIVSFIDIVVGILIQGAR